MSALQFLLVSFLLGLLQLVTASTARAESLLLISIDGLHPDYVLRAEEHGLRLPVLRAMLTTGSYASGVEGVVPTVTYPSHTTLLTGVSPARHGIYSNTPFDPMNVNREGWYWYAEDLRAPTLWQAAREGGLSTAAVNWPVTVGDRHIDYLLPEFWRARTADDLKLIRALSHPPGMLESLESRVGEFVHGYADTFADDQVRTDHSVEILRQYAPDFMAVHLIAPDGEEHRHGPWVKPVYDTLEAVDSMIGELTIAARAEDPDAVIAIVSDHGFFATHTAVNLRVALVEAGLITLAPARDNTAPEILAWDAQFWSSAASAAVVLRDRNDAALRQRVAALLHQLHANPDNGIAQVLEATALHASGGYPDADFLIEFAPGYYFGAALRGPLTEPATSLGTHGYLPQRPEMHAVFFISGKGIEAGKNLGVVDMRAIAPTLAQVLGVNLDSAELPALQVFEER